MKNTKLDVGDILQFSPEHHRYPAHFILVTRPREWGGFGIIMWYDYFKAARKQGKPYIRFTFEEVEFCGKCAWIEEGEEDDDKH